MIKIENLTIKYDEKLILNNISVSFKENSFTTIIGANGCGKTSLIRAISKNLKDTKGTIYINDEMIDKIKKKNLAKIIATLFQFNEIPEDITVEELVSFGRKPFKKMFEPLNSEDYQIINDILIKTNLKKYSNNKVDSLSGGEKQRVFLAMCLVQQPKVLILDEPTNHLDIKYQYEILNIVKEINLNGTTVIATLHDINQALKYSDEIIALKDRKVYSQKKPGNCIDEKFIKEIYDIDSVVHKDQNGLHVDFIVK